MVDVFFIGNKQTGVRSSQKTFLEIYIAVANKKQHLIMKCFFVLYVHAMFVKDGFRTKLI
jgi:hypothetical protein